MTALLIVNPKATTTSERARDILVRALGTAVDLNVGYTRRRGHATSLARQAVAEGMDLVVTLGGDGTVNEVVNGLLEAGKGPDETPRLAVVPGGSTNVFARALGMPVDWVDGTGVILDALRDNRSRTIGLGRANGRYFTFCAGFGLDAAAIRRVERARVKGISATPALYLRSTVAQYFSGADRRHPAIRMEIPGQVTHERLGLAIVQNTRPWTYLGTREVSPNPRASFDTGLDVLSLNEMNLATTIRTASQLLTGRKPPHGKHVVAYHDLKKFKLSSARPQAFQLDGDYLGECDAVELESAPEALRVLC
ncbi:diacylglycerol/lipid kinase family protein [Stackebrandtia nassauensis]|uniref:Diacylglycerol kinase catalytic region n=1 Tax=Stackebrandtia nassauensis (strain DSM 44728 / CIP 108903 / NRRL B-16338 / NBRC 102104 / LLR-40K-21) TaxID=446470 RepID=D3QBQ8_STANL|nr:diacylglycerol kinase family protein [Stackebrandtia nassauensis]ADD44797.1 diacylglycerol kinase catalytic region [Stackebrandtia nassauensis DSM 44728]